MANDYQRLAQARADMQKQSHFYRPTVFWDEASLRIADELLAHGFERFRALPSALSFRWILLRNLREGKQKRAEGQWLGVDTPITGSDYPAMLPDYEVVEQNVVPFGYRTVDGFHSELLLLRLKS